MLRVNPIHVFATVLVSFLIFPLFYGLAYLFGDWVFYSGLGLIGGPFGLPIVAGFLWWVVSTD